MHLIVDEVKPLFDTALVDLEYVIWGDLDTIWVRDFDSCTLAKPTLLSVSGCARALVAQQAVSLRVRPRQSTLPAGRAGTNDPNAGVGYYNTSAMALIFDDMVRYAIIKDFKFSALDNTLMVGASVDG